MCSSGAGTWAMAPLTLQTTLAVTRAWQLELLRACPLSLAPTIKDCIFFTAEAVQMVTLFGCPLDLVKALGSGTGGSILPRRQLDMSPFPLFLVRQQGSLLSEEPLLFRGCLC